MKKFKVMIDYKNFIPIDETELEKALKAMMMSGKVFFANGATERIHAILPDFHAMMGWNYGYELQAEDYELIRDSKDCREAKALISSKLDQLSGREKPKELQNGVRQLAELKKVSNG